MSEVYVDVSWRRLDPDIRRQGARRKIVRDLRRNRLRGRLKNLKAAGIEPKSLTQSEKINVVIIHDQDGNQIIFAQGQNEALQ